MPVRERAIVDEARGAVRLMSRVSLVHRAAHAVPDGLSASAAIAAEALRISLTTWRRAAPRELGGQSPAPSVLAIWPASGHGYGGSISHLTGILCGFRRAGLRIGIVTTAPPGDEIREVADDIEVTAPLPSGERVTGDSIQICSNRPLQIAATQLARRLRPAFVYQRHSPFLITGGEVSRRFGIPLVLEWNASEVWVRKNWQHTLAVERCLDRLVDKAEKAAGGDASVIAAVSDEAANMATRAGAVSSQLLVLPNAVDIEYVDRRLNRERCPQRRLALACRSSRLPARLGGNVWRVAWCGAGLAPRLGPAALRDRADDDRGRESAAHLRVPRRGIRRRRANRAWGRRPAPPQALRRLSARDLLVSPHIPLDGGEPFFDPRQSSSSTWRWASR